MYLLTQCFLVLFLFALVSHQAIPSYYKSSQWSVRGEQCDVHFGVQSDTPLAYLKAFFDVIGFDHQTIVNSDGLLRGYCDELSYCPEWRTIERYPLRWIRPILQQLRCGKAKNSRMLYCCPKVNIFDDKTRIVFPDEISFEEITEKITIQHNQHPNRHLLPGLDQNDCQSRISRSLNIPSTRIMGGKKARIGQYPMIVRLAYKPIDRGRITYTHIECPVAV